MVEHAAGDADRQAVQDAGDGLGAAQRRLVALGVADRVHHRQPPRRVHDPDGEVEAHERDPVAGLLVALCTLLAMTTLNAWVMGVPEKLYKNRSGHPWWSFMMQ